jgi:hypothetical protein
MLPHKQSLSRNTNIETKLGEYLTKLQAMAGEEVDTVPIEDGDVTTILEEIYSEILLGETDICPGGFFGPEDILALMRLLFDYLLGIWENQSLRQGA